MDKRQSIIIWDVEASSVDSNTAIPTLMGLESSESEGFQYTTDIVEFVEQLHQHEIWVGWNIKGYDIPLLQRYGLSARGHIIIDLMEIINGKGFGNDLGRKTIMQTPDGTHLSSVLFKKSMDACAEVLGGPRKLSGDVDYNWFKQHFTTLSQDIKDKAIAYLKRDIEMTSYIYKYLEDFFKDFKDGGVDIDGEFKSFMTKEQKEKKIYLTASPASYVYKLLCNLTGMNERYENKPAEPYGGGFVASPNQESCIGKIYCLDYNSLYPHIMIQANLYGRTTPCIGWVGEGISQTTGAYKDDELAPVGKILKLLYDLRLKYKKEKDEKQYTIKIVINTIYGLLGNPAFASVSDFVAAADCTRLGRQWVNAARLHFAELGYNILYTDTDSVYLEDIFNNKNKLLMHKDEHINDIKKSVPFPVDTFDMGIDDEIRFMKFVKNDSGELIKKSYLYVTQDGKLKMKGMQLMKSTSTKLGRMIFNKYIKPQILESNIHKFQKTQIEKWIEEELANDINLASVFYKIKGADEYASPTGIHAQIASHALYGEGTWNMLKLKAPHTKGAGSNANYVDTKFSDDIKLSMIDLTKAWSELNPFIADTQHSLDRFW